MTWPHAWNYYMSPLGTRPSWQRRPPADYGNAGIMSGRVPGTPAYVEAGQGGTTVAVNVPAEYLWNGSGAVPPALADLADVLVGMLGLSSRVPSRTDSPAYAQFLAQLYSALQECGVAYATIANAIAANAPNAQAIGFAIQQDLQSRPVCASYIKNPIAMPAAPAPTPGAITVATGPGATTDAKPFPWGWVAGGVGVLALVGVAVYFGTRKPKAKRRNPPREENPCGACPNPSDDWIETTGYEAFEIPTRSGVRRNPRQARAKKRAKAGKKRRKSKPGGYTTTTHTVVRRRANEYAGRGGFPSVQPDVMSIEAPLTMPILSNGSRRRNEEGQGRHGSGEPRVVRLVDGGPLLGWEVYSTWGDGSGPRFHGSQRSLRAAQEWALQNLNVGRFDTTSREVLEHVRGGRKRRNPKAQARHGRRR